MRPLVLIIALVISGCGENRAAGPSARSAELSLDAGRYAHLRADGGCYDSTQVSSLTLIDVFEGSQACTNDSDCEIRPLGVSCVPTGCAIAVNRSSCGSWKPRRDELERTLCFNLPFECPVVRVGCATPAPTRVYCDEGFCALTRMTDGGVYGCPPSGCESFSCQ